MADIGPITDEYIDSIIKSAGVPNPNPSKTQGDDLRVLVKLLRDRLEQEIAKATDGGSSSKITLNLYQTIL